MTAAELTRAVKDAARRRGAVLVGVAPVERFDARPPVGDEPPAGHHPQDYLPGARAVISVGLPILNPVLDAPRRLSERELPMIPDYVRLPYYEALYNRVGHVVHDHMLEAIGQAVGQFLLSRGHETMIFPTTGLHPNVAGLTDEEIWEGRPGDPEIKGSPFRYTFGPISHRHAAVRAGLGEFGYSNIVLTKQFGPRQRFNTIVTDAELAPDPLLAEPICRRDECRRCLKACHAEAISLRDDASVRDYRSLDRDDHARVFLDTPSRTDPTKCRRRRGDGRHWPLRGDCLRVCPTAPAVGGRK